jgi:hypothetical protein
MPPWLPPLQAASGHKAAARPRAIDWRERFGNQREHALVQMLANKEAREKMRPAHALAAYADGLRPSLPLADRSRSSVEHCTGRGAGCSLQ